MNQRCGLTWLSTVLLFTLTGIVVGGLLDRVFWEISFDYVYQPAQFLMGGTKVGLLIGTLTAAAATAGGRQPAGPRALLQAGVFMLAAAAGSGLAAGTAAAIISKHYASQPVSPALAPRARVWFCEWLWRGTAAGAICAAGFGNYRLIRNRGANPHNT
ncbi:MAG TPA: hypothetical protein VGM05_07825 [Planctomycetaceae bacterium]|jgi:hypothetical protein